MNNKILYFLTEADKLVAGKYVNPVTCEIDLTTVCQNNCYFCINKESNNDSHSILNLNLLNRLLSELKIIGVKSITFTGGGEPLLHPHFEECVRLVKSYDFKLGLITNGVLLNKCINLSSSFDFIRISLYGINEITYGEKTGKPKNFGLVYKNVKVLVNTLNPKTKPTIGFSYVVPKDEQNIAEAKQFAKELKVDYIQFKPILGNGDDEIEEINLDEKSMITNRFTPKNDMPCKLAGLIGIVSADGNVYYCCMKRGDDKYLLGNLKYTNFSKLWKKRLEIVPDFLKCSSCRYMNYVKGFENIKESDKHFLKHKDFL